MGLIEILKMIADCTNEIGINIHYPNAVMLINLSILIKQIVRELRLEDAVVFKQENTFKSTNNDTKRVIQHTKSRNNKKK